MLLSKYARNICRKKQLKKENLEDTILNRVLTVVDLTALGSGAILGVGIYVLTGVVAKEATGPGVIIALLIAAFTSTLSGLCFAEFGARVPKAGSGYVYSYVTVGELVAFMIGWNQILSYGVDVATLARAFSANLDGLINKTIESHIRSCCPVHIDGWFSEYPDFVALSIVIVFTVLIASGAKEFTTVNKLFTILNISVILFVIIAGLTQADFHNWAWTRAEIEHHFVTTQNRTVANQNVTEGNFMLPHEVNNLLTNTTWHGSGEELNLSKYGSGGFLPFGFSGLITGTATCFYAYFGYDSIAAAGEEAINPRRSIPLGMISSLVICCFAYIGISVAVTLMQPYFLLDFNVPLPYAFQYVGMDWAQYPIYVGTFCALSSSLVSTMFPMPRIIYAMGSDGLLFKFLGSVNERTKTPIIATFVAGSVAGITTALMDLKQLVDLTTISRLITFTLVAGSVLHLRYQPVERGECTSDRNISISQDGSGEKKKKKFRPTHLLVPATSSADATTAKIVNWGMIFSSIAAILSSIITTIRAQNGWDALSIAFTCVCMFVIVCCLVVIQCQPESTDELSFKVPFVPFVAIANIVVNIYMMISLPADSWYKLLVWSAIGGVIYISYGISHSIESRPCQEQKNTSSVLPEASIPYVNEAYTEISSDSMPSTLPVP